MFPFLSFPFLSFPFLSFPFLSLLLPLARSAVGEMSVSFLLSIGLPSIMRSANWARFGLTSIVLIFIVWIAKLAALVVGMVYVWAKTSVSCGAVVPTLYSQASTFLITMIVFYFFQLIFGTGFLICCGIEDAVAEAFHLVSAKSAKMDDEANLMLDEDSSEDEVSVT